MVAGVFVSVDEFERAFRDVVYEAKNSCPPSLVTTVALAELPQSHRRMVTFEIFSSSHPSESEDSSIEHSWDHLFETSYCLILERSSHEV